MADLRLRTGGGVLADRPTAAGAQAATHELPAHRVVMCARAEYCRAALSLHYGFAESGGGGGGGENGGGGNGGEGQACGPVLRLPVSTPEALAALRRVMYTGQLPAPPVAPVSTFPYTSTSIPASVSNTSWASTMVELAAGLEYLMLDDEAAACTAQLARTLAHDGGSDDTAAAPPPASPFPFLSPADVADGTCGGGAPGWRDSIGVSGALAALTTAAECCRWKEVSLFF